MRRTVAILAMCLIFGTLAASPAAAQLVDEGAGFSVPSPVNQTTNVTVTVANDGTTTLTATTQGDVTNQTVGATLPDDVPDPLPDDPVQWIIEFCNDLFGPGMDCF